MLAALFFLFLAPFALGSPVARQGAEVVFQEPTNVTTCSTVTLSWLPASVSGASFDVIVRSVNSTTPVTSTLVPADGATSVTWTAAVLPGQYEIDGQVTSGPPITFFQSEFVVSPGDESCLAQMSTSGPKAGLAPGAIAGLAIAIVAVVLVALVGGGVFYFRARVRRSQREAQLELGPSRQSTVLDISGRAPTPIFRAPTPRAPIMADEMEPEKLQKVLNRLK